MDTTTVEADAPAGDPADYRRVLGHVPTSVAVVTAAGRSGPVGMTIGSFTSVSLDPPLVAFFIGSSSRTWPHLYRASRFGVNILGHNQSAVCRAFARPSAERFDEVGWSASASGVPLLDEAIVALECSRFKVDLIGDHYQVVGRVESLELRASEPPLIFLRGQFVDLSDGSDNSPGR
ncbi:flavin reductase family protein [Nocardia vinacea]|uniref:flavin reductase family protein n=1 Tax=Nocardia vinacea TaxID=96468 RepID=UPI002E0D3522|nr:flavin reductase family protein [Nocardia vinacea]